MNPTSDARATALRGLTAEHSDERLAAVEHFRAALWERQLVKKDVMAAIANAIDDADATVALTAARAVLTQRWRYGDMDRILTALEKDLPEQPELAAKIMAVARRIADPKVLEALSPWLVGLLSSPLPDERAVARTGLANLAHNGTDVGPCVPALVAALGTAPASELEAYIELLYIAAGAQADTRAAEPIVEDYFGSAAPATLRYRAARLVTIGRFARADERLGALTNHVDAAVREGAVDALGAVRRWQGFAQVGVPLLAERIEDPAGGVAQGAVTGLLMAAGDGVDLRLASAAMLAAIGREVEYRAEGRVFPLDGSGYSDLRRMDAVADIAEALVRSAVHHGSLDLLAAPALASERARRGALRALAALEQDPALVASAAAARSVLPLA